jgi:hypothetical protein
MNNLQYQITVPTNEINGINSCNEYILSSLSLFFGSINNNEPTTEINQILPILSGNSKLSIRVIDWFVTNFSKKKNIIYPLNENSTKNVSYFNVYLDYKSQLKGYKKKLFDPFCRKRRIPFYYTKEKCLITTIAQLNFFRWALSNKVLDFIEIHFNEINNDMNETIKNKSYSNSIDSENSDSQSSSDKKRHELSENASRIINCYKMKIVLDMN